MENVDEARDLRVVEELRNGVPEVVGVLTKPEGVE
jgi:hypothetical protein